MAKWRNLEPGEPITLEWIESLPGRFRPAWWHPIRRWAWDHGRLAANGRTILEPMETREPIFPQFGSGGRDSERREGK